MWVEVDPVSEFGIDLVAEVNRQQELFEALPGGAYSGAREIKVPSAAGKAYYVRGQYEDPERGGERVEEVRVLLVHPSENRLVRFTTRYREGDRDLSSARIQELFDWVGWMSPLRSWEQLEGSGEGDGTTAAGEPTGAAPVGSENAPAGSGDEADPR